MKEQIEKAKKAVAELDKDFEIATVWQTKDEFVFMDENSMGVPPVVVDKRTNKARFITIGDPKDMKLAFETATLVERIEE